MERTLPAARHPAIPRVLRGKLKDQVWFFRGVRDALAWPLNSGAAFCPRPCVSHHQGYTAFAAYCRGFHLGCLCSSQSDPRPKGGEQE